MCKFLIRLFKKIDAPLENIIESASTEVEATESEKTSEEIDNIQTGVIEEPEDIPGVIIEESKEEEKEEEIISPVPYEPVYNGKLILLDNGHAKTTPGKRSPKLEDGSQFFEYEFNRDIVKRIADKLDKIGVSYRILVPEVDKDVALSERARRANVICNEYGVENCIFISVHANAAGNGSEWKTARGWSVWTTEGNTKSDPIATVLFEEAEKLLPKFGMTLRKDMSDGDPDYEKNFTVIYKTICPAVLTENLFMDNKTDVKFLMSDVGRDVIADIHVNAIKRLCFE